MEKARNEGRTHGKKRVPEVGSAAARDCPYDGGPDASQENRQKRAAWLEGFNEHLSHL